jgi:hypothetical protein
MPSCLPWKRNRVVNAPQEFNENYLSVGTKHYFIMKFDNENEKNAFFNQNERKGLFEKKIFSTGIHKVLKSQNKTLPRNALAIRLDTNNTDLFLNNIRKLFMNTHGSVLDLLMKTSQPVFLNENTIKKVLPSLLPKLAQILNSINNDERNHNNESLKKLKQMFNNNNIKINELQQEIKKHISDNQIDKKTVENSTLKLKDMLLKRTVENPTLTLTEVLLNNYNTTTINNIIIDMITNKIENITLNENLVKDYQDLITKYADSIFKNISNTDGFENLENTLKLNLKDSINTIINECFIINSGQDRNLCNARINYRINIVIDLLNNPYFSLQFNKEIFNFNSDYTSPILSCALKDIQTLKDFYEINNFLKTKRVTYCYDQILTTDKKATILSSMTQDLRELLDNKEKELKEKEMLTAPKNNIVMRQEFEIPFKNN